MPIQSAGILLYRKRGQASEVFLIHPGGPFWKNKDAGAWSIPKGIIGSQEDPLVAARREFKEETGFEPEGDLRLRFKPKIVAYDDQSTSCPLAAPPEEYAP